MASSISASSLHRRPSASATPRPPPANPLLPDIDPPPKPRPFLHFLAFGFLIFLLCLQFFLPPTHYRDPADPLRSWLPFDPDSSSNSKAPVLKHDERIHIFSGTDCLDLQMLAVLANSTLSSSRFPENDYFHFFVPEGEDEKLSYYKLKVALPHSNMDIIGQKEVKEKLKTALPEVENLWPLLHELTPLIIPIIYPSISRFIYVSSDTIIKGNIEDLFSIDLGPYAIAAADDCSRRLGDYVNIDVLNAIQRTAAKIWVSDKPYDNNTCMPDLNVLLFDAHKLDKKLIEAIIWWSKVLNLKDERSNKIGPAIALAFYNRYIQLPSAWKLDDSMTSKLDNETNVLRYDGPVRVCSDESNRYQGLNAGNLWRQYLPSKPEVILSY